LKAVQHLFLNSLAPVDVDKFKKAPAFAMAGNRAKIGAAVTGLGSPAGGSPAKAAVAAAAAFVRGGSSRGCEFELQLSNLGLHLLQDNFGLVSHVRVCSDCASSVNLEGLKNLIAVRQCLVQMQKLVSWIAILAQRKRVGNILYWLMTDMME
jgi:hypothetical protein